MNLDTTINFEAIFTEYGLEIKKLYFPEEHIIDINTILEEMPALIKYITEEILEMEWDDDIKDYRDIRINHLYCGSLTDYELCDLEYEVLSFIPGRPGRINCLNDFATFVESAEIEFDLYWHKCRLPGYIYEDRDDIKDSIIFEQGRGL